jgi:hypothetical protein
MEEHGRQPMNYVDSGAEETRDSVDGGAWETTNELCGCRSRRNQGFCRWKIKLGICV